MPELPKNEEGGFVFGADALQDVVDAFGDGRFVLMSEDDDDATEVSLMMSAQHVRSEHIDFALQYARSLQVGLAPQLYDQVAGGLDQIVLDNFNLSRPALSVSAAGGGRDPRNSDDVAEAVRALAAAARAGEEEGGEGNRSSGGDGGASHQYLSCSGAIPIQRGREGGVLRRAGGTEAVVELARLAGLPPLGLHATMRVSGLAALREATARWGLPHASTADLVARQRQQQKLVERCGPPVTMPTRHGEFIAHTYRSLVDGQEHIALVKNRPVFRTVGSSGGGAGIAPTDLRPFSSQPAGATAPLVRVHSECCTGDVFGSLRCDCGPQLEKALQAIELDGCGVLLYLRGQEGRGIGLGAKMHAYALQEQGVDTLDANLQLGLPADSREYGTGAQILADLGIRDMRLMSNNPKKFSGLAGFGLRIVERVPSHVAPNPNNIKYLRTKEERMGHLLDLADKIDPGGVGGDAI